MDNKRSGYRVAAAVSLITFGLYLFSLRNGFIEWDDPDYILNNPNIRSLNAALLSWAFTTFHASNWHPLTWISHALDYAIWGLDPLGHHLTNIVLHAANTFLVVMLSMKLMEFVKFYHINHNAPAFVTPSYLKRGEGELKNSPASRERVPPLAGLRGGDKGEGGVSSFLHESGILIAAGVTGLLFGLHPLHVESVAWVSERKDVLCGLFYLLSVLSYLKYRSNKSYKTYFFSFVFFALALMSKPMAVSLPVVLLVLDWYPLRRLDTRAGAVRALTEKAHFVVLSAASSVITLLAQQSQGAVSSLEEVPLLSRLQIAARALIVYLRRMIVPNDLSPFYPFPGSPSFFSLEYLLPFALLCAVTAVCILRLGRQRVFMALWAYYLITLLPVIGLVQVGRQSMADRYTYLPGIGPFLLAGLAAAWWWTRAGALKHRGALVQKGSAMAALVLLLFLSYMTIQQIALWRDSIVFWTEVIRRDPFRVPIAYTNRGAALKGKGELELAVEDFSMAITLNPKDYKAYVNRGKVFYETGDLDRAISDYTASIAIKPSNADIYIQRGVALKDRGEPERAMEDYNKALELAPGNYSAHVNRGVVFKNMGRPDLAMEDYNRAIAVHPELADAYVNRGVALQLLKEPDRAIEDYTRAISLNPGLHSAYNNRGMVFREKGEPVRAIEDFSRAIELRPDLAVFYLNRGMALRDAGGPDKAIEDFTQAVLIDPGLGEAYRQRGELYLETGSRQQAEGDYQRACELGIQGVCNVLRRNQRPAEK